MEASAQKTAEIPYEVLADAMSESYEGVYAINAKTGAYSMYYSSPSFKTLNLAKSGGNFFAALSAEVDRVIAPDDRNYVKSKLSHEELDKGVRSDKYHTFVYRVKRDGRLVYHQVKATLVEIEGEEHYLMGVRDVDEVVRQSALLEDELESERQKSANYLDAVLATAAAYADVNLTEDTVLVHHTRRPGTLLAEIPPAQELRTYNALHAWTCDNLVCENLEAYQRIGGRENLLECFAQGAGRASVSFSAFGEDGSPLPCREVFYLYRERTTDNIRALCVVYDLTQQQRREKELAEVRAELEKSRIHNSASQMKPHFLYNALGSIQEVMLEDPERAASLLEDFTVHLRGCIKAMNGDVPIPFSSELDNIKAYVHIEAMRLGDKLKVRYDIKEDGFSVLPLSIQPLVENAIRHGIHKRGKHGGTVELATWAEDGAWVVRVTDDGVGFDLDEYEQSVLSGETDSTGIRNIRFRLEEIMKASLDIKSTPGEGTIATVRIPMKAGAR